MAVPVSGRSATSAPRRLPSLRSALAGVLPDPVQGRRSGVEDRDVSVVWAQPQFCRPDMAREPLGVRTGCDPILATVQDEDWRGYLPGVKPPRGDVCEVVIHHPP